MVAQLLIRMRHAPDRLLHGVRRRAALAMVVARRRPTLVLVVCYGNVCRSPFGAAALRRALAGTPIVVASGGFVGSDRRPPAEAIAAAAERGLDLSRHRSRLLVPDVMRAAGLVVVMEPGQRDAVCARFGVHPPDVLVLGDLDPEPLGTRAIHDPVHQPAEVFDEVYARIERCVGALAGALKRLPRERTGLSAGGV